MCRLCAVTLTQLHPEYPREQTDYLKSVLLHEMMLRGSVEEQGQRNGWGVTDTHNVWKSTAWYIESAPYYLNNIVSDDMLIGHVRKASTGTNLTVNENHPFRFDLPDGRFFWAAHNGWIDGAKPYQVAEGNPHSDSWYAFRDLQSLLAENPQDEITEKLIEDWLSAYGNQSHYAFLIHYGGVLHAIRGDSRPLHIMRLGNGFLIDTSKQVLDTMQSYARSLLPGVETGEVLRIVDHCMLKFQLGVPEYTDHHFKIVKKVAAGFQPPAPPPVANVPIILGGERNVANSGTVTKPLTPPRKTKNTPEDVATGWRVLSGRLSPLRGPLSKLWAALSLGYRNSDGSPLVNDLLSKITTRELELLTEMLAPVTEEDGKEVVHKPFSLASCLMINAWNHFVIPGMDIEAHAELFGDELFWIDPRFTACPDEDAYGKFSQWYDFVCAKISYEIDPSKVARLFDVRALVKTNEVLSA